MTTGLIQGHLHSLLFEDSHGFLFHHVLEKKQRNRLHDFFQCPACTVRADLHTLSAVCRFVDNTYG